ncbi:MAG: RsmB/NOP family class I SAM-dependent RNA methyltransferase [Lachnospiraceae bacterium]|nr:RsmB/NOP family class I SAM-dependent RNA methyltransferase [Lachnospiraceae bacterium]
MELPVKFLERMENMLGEEYAEFLASYEKERVYGLRINTLKMQAEEALRKLPFQLEPVSWCDTGFYYKEEERPGKSPYHEAGLYYIQEPSAMITAELAQIKPGEKVLDLCAAPGGKTTQIACKLQGEGILVSNEINSARAAILSQNVERMGIKNGIVTNENPKRLSEHFVSYFDKIIVDAPCSGEGMFKKEPIAVAEWSEENVENCAKRQAEILTCAAKMLKPGGRIVYSTCTFAKQENEDTIENFVKENEEFQIISMHRIWPHKEKGEGHFAAVLEKEGEVGTAREILWGRKIEKSLLKQYEEFAKDTLQISFDKEFIMFGDNLYALPAGAPNLDKLKVLRPGLHLGSFKKKRFEPSHALSHALKPEECKHVLNLSYEQLEVLSYLKGETIHKEGEEKGWYLVCVEGIPMGFAKYSNGMFKNHYPKGLRIF